MLIPGQRFKINIKNCNNTVKEYYQKLGYLPDEAGYADVDANKLWEHSHTKVRIICDYCGNIFEQRYKDYFRGTRFLNKCACKECIYQKRQEINMLKYGVPETLSLKNVQEKKEKTCIAKYGGKSPMCSEEVRLRQQDVLRKKYGVSNPSLIEEAKQKKALTKYQNNTCRASEEQIRIANLFDGDINYPIGSYNVDILLNNNIVIEYDGDGHNMSVKYHEKTQEEFDLNEEKRTNYILSKGYKIIRFINKKWWNKISDNDYLQAFQYCVEKMMTNNKNTIDYVFS